MPPRTKLGRGKVPSKLGRGKPLKNQSKELLHKIYKYFETEIKRDPKSTVTAAQLVTHATGVSLNALKKVIDEHNTNVTVKKEYRSQNRRYPKGITSDVFDTQALRRIIHGYYTKDEEFPTMKDLYMTLKAEIDYQGSLCTLRRHVAKLGFKWMEREDNNSTLIEKHDTRFARVQYLSKIEAFRSEGRNIVYTAEAYIESSRYNSQRPKADGSSSVLKQPAKSKLVVLLAGDKYEVIRKTLFTYHANKRDVKDRKDKRENFEQYETWLKMHLIPHLKPNSVVVVDGGSAFHNRTSNTTPHSNSRRTEMMEYLASRNVPYSNDMYKSQLYQLILLNKDKHFDYKTDALLKEHGHCVLRLPPYHPDLNPIKTIVTTVRNYVGKDVVCLSVDNVMKIAREKVISFGPEEWKQVCDSAEVEENNLRAIDKVIDEISESAFKSADEDSDESDIIDDENASDQESTDSE